MSDATRAEAGRLAAEEEIRDELRRSFKPPPPPERGAAPPPDSGRGLRVLAWACAALALGTLRLLLRHGPLARLLGDLPLLERLATGGFLLALLLAARNAVEVYLLALVAGDAARFDLRRVVRLLAAIGVAVVVLSLLFTNWYAAAVSLGLLSLILGFALQTPITSFIGWVYLLVRRPYRIGDRVRIGEATGDVIDISYLDTTLWEFGGDYLSTDHPSGRIIRFPNSKVLEETVWNYSWPLFPYVWNELKVQISYEADLERVARVMQEVAEAELGEEMMEKVRVYRELLSRTPVDHLEVQERPVVFFRVAENTWIEAIVRYLVEPKRAGRVRSSLLREVLARLDARAADQTLFPKANLR